MNHTDELNSYESYRSSSFVQIIRINHELAYLRRRVILELTKNTGCTNNKASTPSNNQTNFVDWPALNYVLQRNGRVCHGPN